MMDQSPKPDAGSEENTASETQASQAATPAPSSSTPPPSTAQSSSAQSDLNRVRELIMGPDAVQQRMRGAEVDRLREIIFGSQMDEYERRFADLRRDVERVLTDVRLVQDEVSDFQKAQTKRLENLERETRQAISELKREVERMRGQETMMQQLLTQVRQQELLARNLRENSESMHKSLNQHEQDFRSLKTTVNENRDQHERKLDAVRREVRQGEDKLLAELRRISDRLSDQKVDRKAFAGMLMEIATRLETGNSLTGLLEELNTPPPSEE